LYDKADSPAETSKYGEQEQFQEFETLTEIVLGENISKAETIIRRTYATPAPLSSAALTTPSPGSSRILQGCYAGR
jgi:hypothetical protein